MATPNRFAMRDAGIATFYDLQTGKAIVTLNTLKTSGLETNADVTYAQGGFGNPRLVGFSSGKTGQVTLQDALFDKYALGMLTGNALKEGKKVIDFNEQLTVTSNKITLSKTPVGALVSVYKVNEKDGTNGEEYTLGTPSSNEKEFSISGKEVTFHTKVTNGTIIRVYYKVQTSADAKTIRVSSDAFGGTFKVVLDVLVRDSADGLDYAAQIVVPRAKFNEQWSISLDVAGDPAVLDLPLEILNDPVTNTMWEMVVYHKGDIL